MIYMIDQRFQRGPRDLIFGQPRKIETLGIVWCHRLASGLSFGIVVFGGTSKRSCCESASLLKFSSKKALAKTTPTTPPFFAIALSISSLKLRCVSSIARDAEG